MFTKRDSFSDVLAETFMVLRIIRAPIHHAVATVLLYDNFMVYDDC